MKHYKPPICQAEFVDDPMRVCGYRMEIVGERHPLWKARHWTFVCPRCHSVRQIFEPWAGRYVEER